MTDIEILYFDGCPNHAAAANLVQEVFADSRVDVDACRVYRTAEGTSGIPDRSWVAGALEAAA